MCVHRSRRVTNRAGFAAIAQAGHVQFSENKWPRLRGRGRAVTKQAGAGGLREPAPYAPDLGGLRHFCKSGHEAVTRFRFASDCRPLLRSFQMGPAATVLPGENRTEKTGRRTRSCSAPGQQSIRRQALLNRGARFCRRRDSVQHDLRTYSGFESSSLSF